MDRRACCIGWIAGQRTTARRPASEIASAREAFGGKLGEILLKAPLLVLAELAQIGPGIEAGVVAVIEHDAGGVIADRLDAQDAHRLLAGHGDALFGAMALHLGAWAHHP